MKYLLPTIILAACAAKPIHAPQDASPGVADASEGMSTSGQSAADAGTDAGTDGSVADAGLGIELAPAAQRKAPEHMSLGRGQAIWDEGYDIESPGNSDCAARQLGRENPDDVLAFLLHLDRMDHGQISEPGHASPAGASRRQYYLAVISICTRQIYDLGQDPPAFSDHAVTFIQTSIQETEDARELDLLAVPAISILSALHEYVPEHAAMVLREFLRSGYDVLLQPAAEALYNADELTKQDEKYIVEHGGLLPQPFDPGPNKPARKPDSSGTTIFEPINDPGISSTGGYVCELPYRAES